MEVHRIKSFNKSANDISSTSWIILLYIQVHQKKRDLGIYQLLIIFEYYTSAYLVYHITLSGSVEDQIREAL